MNFQNETLTIDSKYLSKGIWIGKIEKSIGMLAGVKNPKKLVKEVDAYFNTISGYQKLHKLWLGKGVYEDLMRLSAALEMVIKNQNIEGHES